MNGFSLRINPHSPRNSFLLNGSWELSPSSSDLKPETFLHRVPVPGVVDCAYPPYAWKDCRFHWYRTTFQIEGDLPSVAFLRIGQSQFGTDAWVNGVHVGRNISCYTSQEYRVRPLLQSSGKSNEIVMRVGVKENLPNTSAVGKDLEKQIYTPGIWGDVRLIMTENPRIVRVQTIPDLAGGKVQAVVTLENQESKGVEIVVEGLVEEKKSKKQVSEERRTPCSVGPCGVAAVSLELPIHDPIQWTPESPFLYKLVTRIWKKDRTTDETETTFGMREFGISGNKFLLNGKRVFLRGGNIAFHRFLSDKERGELPWNPEWIRKALIEIPKEHNFNFFRNHLGQLYPLWYDLADEGGILIQNEWHFWGATGSKEEIRRELTEWIQENWNHPSIVIWDALNESTDETIQKEIVPELKKVDPTRVWESVDFVEEHPYIYSLGPVLNDRRFGFTRALAEIEESKTPAMLNEFVWWWLDSAGKPTSLMDGVVERWLGRGYTTEDLLSHQAFLATELIELFRRMKVAAIQPFVYLSNNDGPTGHWFLGPIASLRPKPILAALKNAFTPFGVSIELWDRHFVPGEQRMVRIFIFNDKPEPQSGTLTYGIVDASGRWLSKTVEAVNVGGSESRTIESKFELPGQSGRYDFRAEVAGKSGVAISTKIAFVVRIAIPQNLNTKKLAVFGGDDEMLRFMESKGIAFTEFPKESLEGSKILIVSEGEVRKDEYAAIRSHIDRFVERGGTLVVIEPERGLEGSAEIALTDKVRIRMSRREDADRGGYDSFVFMDDPSHPLWGPLRKELLQMFNGAFGGEIVSQHDLEILSPHRVLARCGLHLKVIAVAEIESGAGRILISRLQTRGRLDPRRTSSQLFERRRDPVAQQYMLQLLWYAGQNVRSGQLSKTINRMTTN